ncbi:MAG: 3'-5' exonuclease [Bacteroidales bacterium]|nr:3'-5' exonuclease [Bacteroidales bacterium]
MQLNLKKPLVFFDLETTGTNAASDRIVQISYIKVMPNGEEIARNYYVNPEMHIPEEASAVHHIFDADVADKPTFKQLAKTLANDFLGCDFAGFNSNRFDVPLLIEEMLRVGVNMDITKCHFVDVQNIFHKKEPRTLVAAYKFYCGKDLDDAHSADADTRATYEVLKAQLDRYSDLENNVAFLESYTKMNRNIDPMGCFVLNDSDVAVFAFGKYKGKGILDVLREDPSYYSWMMNGNFALSTKTVLTQYKLSMMSSK